MSWWGLLGGALVSILLVVVILGAAGVWEDK